jgi:hypothetical protein
LRSRPRKRPKLLCVCPRPAPTWAWQNDCVAAFEGSHPCLPLEANRD